MYSLYADESYVTNDGDFFVAGYLLGSKRADAFSDAWAAALGPLEYFHMSERHYRRHADVYANLLRLLTPDYLVAGFSASVNQTEYRRVMNQRLHGNTLQYWFGGHYSFCIAAIADLANRWLNANNPGERDIAYVFEAGNSRQGEADRALQMINDDPALADWKRRVRYFSHTFMDGKRREAAPLQAADMLAWHVSNSAAGTRPPEDVRERLLAVTTYQVHYPEGDLAENVHAQLQFCEFYKDLRQASRISI